MHGAKRRKERLDVTKGAPDGEEVCELAGLFLLSLIKERFPTLEFGLFRDDGLAVHSRMPKMTLETYGIA